VSRRPNTSPQINFLGLHFEMKGLFVTLLAIALVDSSSAQTSFYAMYKMFSSKDTFCGGSYQNVYNSDLNEARIEVKDSSITSAKCYKNALGQYTSRTCNSTSDVISLATFSSSDCSGSPDSVSTVYPNGFCIGSPASAHWSVRDFEPSLRPGIIGKRKKMKKKVIHLF
jgi:hypothetical protein